MTGTAWTEPKEEAMTLIRTTSRVEATCQICGGFYQVSLVGFDGVICHFYCYSCAVVVLDAQRAAQS